ncbi:hypothetical protein LIER_30688 [Lithospermum erythrorhizon]|uniref:Uncharacterized protein n=1 Tax=Lithospermum erythrorhizon TaxID=34254 RepID=A0AAV3RQU2_LITER
MSSLCSILVLLSEAIMFETNAGSSSYISASDVNKWHSLHFSSVDDAYSFYCDHGHRLGFSVIKGFKEGSLYDPSHEVEIESSLVQKKNRVLKVKEEKMGCDASISFRF